MVNIGPFPNAFLWGERADVQCIPVVVICGQRHLNRSRHGAQVSDFRKVYANPSLTAFEVDDLERLFAFIPDS